MRQAGLEVLFIILVASMQHESAWRPRTSVLGLLTRTFELTRTFDSAQLLVTIHNIKVQTVRARRHRRLGLLSQFRHVRRRERGRDEDPIGGEDV